MKKITLKKMISLAAAGALALAMTACSEQAAQPASQTAENTSGGNSVELKTLRVGVPGFDDNPLLENGRLAQKLGYFDEELAAAGYKFELVTFQEADLP